MFRSPLAECLEMMLFLSLAFWDDELKGQFENTIYDNDDNELRRQITSFEITLLKILFVFKWLVEKQSIYMSF